MYTSVSQSERNHPLGGDFHGQGGKNTKGGDWGVKKHQGGENAQFLMDH